jgi:putative transposase
MNERTTNDPRTKKEPKTDPRAETPDTQGVGAKWQRGGNGPKASNSSPHVIPVEKGDGARGSDLFKRHPTESGSRSETVTNRESETQRDGDAVKPGIDAFKKKDELGLSDRVKGCSYSTEQRQRIIQEVESLFSQGTPKAEILRSLTVSRSTYYGWLKKEQKAPKAASILALTDPEEQAVIEKKQAEPQLSHRQISGVIRQEGYYVSPSSCYRILKELGWIWPQSLREAPWKVPRFEPFRSNQIWGEDWTILTIADRRHYLLTILDYFSRYIIAWGVVPTVTQKEVQNLLTLAYLSEGLEHQKQKPILRADLGSPNIAKNTKRLIKDLEMILCLSRVHRPTDNARQERWYRTVKQEEIYCYPSYPSLEIARGSLANYIRFYNDKRPHQALWNYTPSFVHRLGNKTKLVNLYRRSVQVIKEQRIGSNRLKKEALPEAIPANPVSFLLGGCENGPLTGSSEQSPQLSLLPLYVDGIQVTTG